MRTRLWHLEHLENSSSEAQFNADFAASLERVGLELAKGLDYFTSPTSASRMEFESNPNALALALNPSKQQQQNQSPLKLGKKLKEFIFQASQKLDLNEAETFKIYFTLKKLKLKTLLESNSRQELDVDEFSNRTSSSLNNIYHDSLFQDMLFLYNQERIGTIDLMTALFRACQDTGHLYHQVAKQITASWMALSSSNSAGFKKKVLDDYVTICKTDLSAHLENYPDRAAAWTRQNLLEQKALLELCIMMYYSNYPSPEETLDVIKSLVQLKLGSLQANRPFFDRIGLEIYRQIEDLTTVLVVEVLNFQVALDRLLAPPSLETLLDRPDSIAAANTLIWEMVDSFRPTQDHNPVGVIALAWSSYMQFLTILLSQSCPASYSDLFSMLSNTHPDVKSPQLLFQWGYQSAGALDYLSSLLLPTTSFIQHDSNEMAYKSVIRELLNMLLVTQNVSALPNRQKLVRVFSSLYHRNAQLCNHFWTLDFGLESRASLLEACQRSFPAVSFFDFIGLATSLIAGADSADYACQYLSMMPSFCDFARGADWDQSFEQVQGLTIWRWKAGGSAGSGTKSLIYGSPNFKIAPDPGTEAYEVGTNVLLVKFQYSAWHLFLAYLDSFLHQSDMFEDLGDIHVGSVAITAAILKLFNCVLENADSATRQDFLTHLASVPGNGRAYGENPEELLTGIVGEIMNRCSASKVPMMDVISECLQTVKFLLPHYPEVVWKRLRGSNLFPQYAYATGSAGYFQTAILPLECAAGNYPTTISFLSLVKHLALEAQKLNVHSKAEQDLAPATILYSCVFFILRDVFSTYNSWRFAQIHEKFQITLLVLETLEIIMEDSTWYQHEQQQGDANSFSRGRDSSIIAIKNGDSRGEICLSSVTRLVLETYVFSASNYQLSPLLDVIAMGANGPNSFYNSNRKREALLVEQCMIAGLKLLKRFLLALTHYNHASGLESALLDRTVSTSDGPVEFVQIIASLIDYQNNSDFAQLATENLTLLCVLSKKPGRPTTFFVGYFGAEAFSLVSKFIDLVRVEDQRASTSPAIQTAVYSFMTSVVDSQPGLGAMFLSGFEPKSIASSLHLRSIVSSPPTASKSSAPAQIPVTSILYPLMGVLKKWKKIQKENPSILLACLVLLDTLWQSAPEHQSTIKLLRGKQEFWTSLLEIVKDKVEPANQVSTKDCSNWCHFISAQAYTLRLLSVEMYLFFRRRAKNGAEGVSAEEDVTCKNIMSTMVEVLVTRPIPMGQDALFHHPEYTEELQRHCARLEPQPLVLEGYRRITWNDAVDADRKFGSSFVYNIHLLERKLKSESSILNQVALVNMDWSFTDVQIVMLRASLFATKLLTSSAAVMTSISKKDTLHLVKVVLKNLQMHTQPHFIHIDYKNDLAKLLVHLISFWLADGAEKTTDRYDDDVEQLFFLISMLQKSTMTAHFPFGPLGTFSNYPFHAELFSGMLLLVVRLSSILLRMKKEKVEALQKRIDSLYLCVIQSLCEALSNLMGGTPLPLGSSSSGSGGGREESLVLSLLFELTRRGAGASTSVWLPLFQKYQVIPLLINGFSTWHPKGAKSTNLCYSPEKVLELILSLASHPACAALLISNGLIASLCNNSFSNELGTGGGVGQYDGMEVAQVHQIWCLVVSIISELVLFLEPDSSSVATFPTSQTNLKEAIVGFICLYQNQILSSLHAHLNGPLTLRSCWEVERVMGLFVRLADANVLIPSLHEQFQDKVLLLMGLYVFFFKNPHELGHRVLAISRSEVLMTTAGTFRACIDEKLVGIAGYMVDFLLRSTGGLQLSCSFGRLIIAPTLSSFQDTFGATFGTCVDLLGHFFSCLLNSSILVEQKERLVCRCESLITLIAAQLLRVKLGDGYGHAEGGLDVLEGVAEEMPMSTARELFQEFLLIVPEAPDYGFPDSLFVTVSASASEKDAFKSRVLEAREYVAVLTGLVREYAKD